MSARRSLAHRAILPATDPRRVPEGFFDWPTQQKLEWMFEANLDRIACVVSWPVEKLNGTHLAVWERVATSLLRVQFGMLGKMLDAKKTDEAIARVERMFRGETSATVAQKVDDNQPQARTLPMEKR